MAKAPPKKKRKSPAKRRPAPARAISAVEREGSARAFPVEIDPQRIEETLKKIRSEVAHWANKSRYTRVRFKFRGKQLLPDLPLGAVLAAEGLTFYWGGILRMLIFNLAGKTVFDVELVNDSVKRVQQGREALLSGDLDGALRLFREAVAMQRDNAQAHLNLGAALKLKGDVPGSRQALETAKTLDPKGALGVEAERLLQQLRPVDAGQPSAMSPYSGGG